MGSIFGGGKQKSQSNQYNKAWDSVSSAFTPLLGNAAQGAQDITSFLGGDSTGFNLFKKATGFDAAAEAGSRGITGNAAAGGLLRSGGTAKALQAFGNQMQNQYANDYLSNLFNRANLGFNAANALTSAGQVGQSTRSGKSKNGIGDFLGSVAGGIAASDRRLKINIHKVGEKNGLNLYQFRYLDGSGPFVGYMADEVEKTYPEAIIIDSDGYKAVNYGMIGGV